MKIIKKKILDIFKNTNKRYNVKFDSNVSANLKTKEEFEFLPRHKNIIKDFISYNNEVDFSLII